MGIEEGVSRYPGMTMERKPMLYSLTSFPSTTLMQGLSWRKNLSLVEKLAYGENMWIARTLLQDYGKELKGYHLTLRMPGLLFSM